MKSTGPEQGAHACAELQAVADQPFPKWDQSHQAGQGEEGFCPNACQGEADPWHPS